MTTGSSWKKIPNEIRWQRYIQEIDVTLSVTIEPAGYDNSRRYVLGISYDGQQLKNFHKFRDTDGSNLSRYYPAKNYPIIKKMQSRIDEKIQIFLKHIWYITSGSKEIDTIVENIEKYTGQLLIDKFYIINQLVKFGSDAVTQAIAHIDDLARLIAAEKAKYNREFAIWDSLDNKYKCQTKKVYVGTETRTDMVRNGWQPGRWTVSGSDNRDDWVYVPPYRSGPDEYSNYNVDIYNDVKNEQYIEPPTESDTLKNLQNEYSTELQKLKRFLVPYIK